MGEGVAIPTPFGVRPLLYADYTASGRALGFVEQAIHAQVLPYYANTHTETSYTGKVTTQWREAARQAVADAVGATDDDVVLFCGAGATAAIDRCSKILALHQPSGALENAKPVIFIGPYEHHSNDLIWRECDADLVRIPLNEQGLIDLVALERELAHYAERPLKVAAFSAASNVTGIKTDVTAIAKLVHRYGGIALFDYAASGPYVPINVAGSGQDDHLDAIFLSPHKFVGGPGSSGVLVIKKALCRNAIPGVAGGGTVAYVTASDHRYVDSIQRREEGGTPDILGNIRAGLAFHVKAQVGAELIESRERELVAMAMQRWSGIDNLTLLGPSDADRLAIFSFNIRAGERDIHHGLIVAMLNDLFGIQARGGCSCAGPYGHELLGINPTAALEHERLVLNGRSLYRPGWVRLGFNFFFSNESANYVISAVEFIARYAAVLMKLYTVDERSGNWRVRSDLIDSRQDVKPPLTLDTLLSPEAAAPDVMLEESTDYFALASELVSLAQQATLADDPQNPDEPIRWFWWPHEADKAVHSQNEMTQ